MSIILPIHGRGSSDNPPNRFEPIYIARDAEFIDPDDPLPKTEFFRDEAKEILAKNNSPDIPFTYSINPYRGCEHGCVYCYARPTHEWIGLSAGLDFETKIFAKMDAPTLLRNALSKKTWEPQPISISGVTDPYQPVERKLEITRNCLKILAEFRNPVGIVTKNALVTRDCDVLKELAENKGVIVFISITTLNAELQQKLEPRASHPDARLRAIETLTQAGIPTGVMVAPLIPGLTEDEMPEIIQAAARAGAKTAGYVLLRLPYGVKELFQQWLEHHYPDRKAKILGRIYEMRNGQINQTEFGQRMVGSGDRAELMRTLFRLAKKKARMTEKIEPLSTEHFRVPGRLTQRSLFE
jgi:DNA repair photolyase